MTEHAYLDTTVTKLMQLFREALIALIPVMDRAKIAWRDPEAYDDWDAICQALFEQMVVNSIRHGFDAGQQQIHVARWGSRHASYANLDRIVAGCESRHVVIDLATRAAPFDTVITAELGPAESLLRQAELPFEGLEFGFSRHFCGTNAIIKKLHVLL